MATFSFSQFREIACVGLSAVTGFLIGVPLLALTPGPLGVVVLITLAIIGGVVGFRKRRQPIFFYVSLVSVLFLSSVILKSFVVQ